MFVYKEGKMKGLSGLFVSIYTEGEMNSLSEFI